MAVGEKITVQLAGQEFRIAPPRGDAERLTRIAAYVSEKVDGVTQAGVVSTQRSALLAALEIAFELFDLREAHPALSESEVHQLEGRLDEVIGRLDHELNEGS